MKNWSTLFCRDHAKKSPYRIFFSPQKVTTKFLIPKGKFALHHAKLFLSIAIELSYKYRCWLSSVFIVFIGSRSKQQDPGPHGHKNVISQEAIWLHCFATAPAVSTLFQFSEPYVVNIAIFWAFFLLLYLIGKPSDASMMDEELMCESLMKWVGYSDGIRVECLLSFTFCSLIGDTTILWRIY